MNNKVYMKLVFVGMFLWSLFLALLFMVLANIAKCFNKIVSESIKLAKWSYTFNKDIYLK